MGVEVAFFVPIFSTGIGCFCGLVSFRFAFYQFVISLLVSLIICHRGKSQLFHVTRSTFRKYQLHFVELCVHVHLLCALLSLLGKYRANNFLSDVAVLFQLRTLSTFHILDVVATLSILAVHLAGHHDAIDRIRKRLGWFGRGVQRYVRWLGEVSLNLLAEVPSDLEDQPHQKQVVQATGGHVHDPEDDESSGRFRRIRRVSSNFVRNEIRAFAAQARWASVRHALGFQRSPFQDPSFLIAVLAQAFEFDPMFRADNLEKFEPRFPHSSSRIPSAAMRTLCKAQVPRQGFDGTRRPTADPSGANLPLFMQLPGIIQRKPVKALADTGSSQNVVDSKFVQALIPAVTVKPTTRYDKPLVAPDGVIIPCIGKVYLPWAFKNEATEVYKLWFYVIENCSPEVIIGNGFLMDTKTLEEHMQERVEISRRSDLELHPGNLVSGQQDSSCRRQIVSGIINGQSIGVSLDTGCEANLMSDEYAKQRGLTPIPLPGGNQEIEFINGRKGSTRGQVEIDWSFDDDSPDVVVKIKCYVLPVCIHSVIFGVQFAISEKPWEIHRSTLSWKELPDTGDFGVVGLREHHRFWPFGNKKRGGFPPFGLCW